MPRKHGEPAGLSHRKGSEVGVASPITYMSVRQSQIAFLSGVPEVWNEEMNFSCSVASLSPSASASAFSFWLSCYGGNFYESHG